ncbi:hypothetical protein LJR130_003818 [Variovorax sp. LjRoot130]|uniref:hypothetical protein n=2 Tax=unclassified Variovorax TaxID=663243 RepID=UPI003ECEC409
MRMTNINGGWRPLAIARENADRFTPEFLAYLPENLHVYEAFEREAFRVVAKGFQHYSARTIIEVLRHHAALAEVGGPWKLNDWHTPYLARLFALANPAHRDLFEFREAKAVRRREAANADHMHTSAGGSAC